MTKYEVLSAAETVYVRLALKGPSGKVESGWIASRLVQRLALLSVEEKCLPRMALGVTGQCRLQACDVNH